MAWNPYTDQKNRAFSHILTTLFPEQTKTLPRILVWSVIFLIDLSIGAYCAFHFGLLDWCNDMNTMALASGLWVLAVIGVFWLQGVIWGAFVKILQELKR